MTFHHMFVHIIFVAEWPLFGTKVAHSVDYMFSLYFDYL